MSKKAWLVLAVLALAGLGAVPALAQSSTKIKVSPRTGGKKAKFGVSFQSPDSVSSGSQYMISATGPSNKHGCVASASQSVFSAQQGATVKVMFKPGAGKRWCVGKFKGTVERIIRPVCGGCPPPPTTTMKNMVICPARTQIACPESKAREQFIAIEPVGTFSFRVEKIRKGATRAPRR
jgi:hypothetical protein